MALCLHKPHKFIGLGVNPCFCAIMSTHTEQCWSLEWEQCPVMMSVLCRYRIEGPLKPVLLL